MTIRLHGCLLTAFCLLFFGCGEDSDGSGDASGGTSGQTSMGAGGDAGDSGQGGNPSGGGSSCPVWPAQKLLPLIGPQFFGPDPGACSETDYWSDGRIDVETFFYREDGRADYSESEPGVTNCRYDYDPEGRLMWSRCSSDDHSVQYEANQISVIPFDRTGYMERYWVDEQGYPVRTQYVHIETDVPMLDCTYTCQNCRFFARSCVDEDGNVIESQTTSFIYDSEGHLIERTLPDLRRVYDYSCWDQ